MENLKLQLLEATLMDIKTLVKENSNNMELGGKIRNYFNNLPEVINDFKDELDKNKKG